MWNCQVIQMGELRHADTLSLQKNGPSTTSERKHARCLGTPHPNYGYGNVNTHECNGRDNQIWALCADGTIRNLVSKWCLTREPHGLQSGSNTLVGLNVVTRGCSVPTPSSAQLWRQTNKGAFTDYLTGLRQTRFRFKSANSDSECLSTPYDLGYDNGIGVGDVISIVSPARCANGPTTLWYFNDRGGVVASGRLVNQDTGKCFVQRAGGEQSHVFPLRIHVGELDCKEDSRQIWTLYQSGELVNANEDNWCYGFPDFCRGGRHCLGAEADLGTGIVANAQGCRPYADIRWEAINPVVGTFLLRNKESQQCLRISGGNAQMSGCVDSPDHRFRWEASGWQSPVGEWVQKHCHYNGPAPRTFTSSLQSTNSMTETTTLTVGTEIEKGVIFSSAKVSTSVSQALAVTWTQTNTDTESVTFPCANFGDGTPITGFNCMYQWRQTIVWPREDTITWNPLIIQCTNSYDAPKCPAFEKCANAECSECETV